MLGTNGSQVIMAHRTDRLRLLSTCDELRDFVGPDFISKHLLDQLLQPLFWLDSNVIVTIVVE
jgi:hypothetical protein